MPLYEYRCRACGDRFERIQKFSDPPVAECPSCGGEVEKLVSSPAFQFKGSGWYVTDYARKAESTAKSDKGDSGTSSSAVKSGESSDSAKTDEAHKPAAKPAEKPRDTANKSTTPDK